MTCCPPTPGTRSKNRPARSSTPRAWCPARYPGSRPEALALGSRRVEAPEVEAGEPEGRRRSVGRDDRLAFGSLGDGALLGEAHSLLDQRLHDPGFGHGGDHLAADEDLALAVARGDAEVGLAGLARAVDHAAHDRDP